MKELKIIEDLWEIITDRACNPVKGSYTTEILTHRKGIDKSLEKLGEEVTEYILAVKNGDKESITYEAADLVFHFLLSLKAVGVEPEAVLGELQSRRK